TRSAAGSRSNTRRTTTASFLGRRFRPTTASSCRLRWPGSGTSRRSTARWAAFRGERRGQFSWLMAGEILVTGAAGFAGSHLLDALERANVAARVLVPSSALVYASAPQALTEADPLVPNSPYGVSKLAQEMLAQRSNGALAIAIARPFNHVGPRQDPHFVASA